MTDTLENKSPAARRRKYMRGVRFDKRIQKFTAEIRIAGKRIYLGSFETEEDAAAAHALWRHDNPIRRGGVGGGPTFQEAYTAFLEDHAAQSGKRLGWLEPGLEFTAPSGQKYFLGLVEEVHHPTLEKICWVYNRWFSECSECGAEFVTSTRRGQKHMSGMTRTCWKHRKNGPRPDEPKQHGLSLKKMREAREKARREQIEFEKETAPNPAFASFIAGKSDGKSKAEVNANWDSWIREFEALEKLV